MKIRILAGERVSGKRMMDSVRLTLLEVLTTKFSVWFLDTEVSPWGATDGAS